MQNEGGFERFGQPDRFALDLRLLPDPDGDNAAPAASIGSWGQWRLWVGGINLTEHDLAVASGQVVRQEHVTWYLAPLLRWLATVWTPLLHEEHFPSTIRRARDARSAYISVASTQMDDSEVFSPWQDWAARHGLRWAAEGGWCRTYFCAVSATTSRSVGATAGSPVVKRRITSSSQEWRIAMWLTLPRRWMVS